MIAYYSGFSGIEIETIEYGIEDKVVFTAERGQATKAITSVKYTMMQNGPISSLRGKEYI